MKFCRSTSAGRSAFTGSTLGAGAAGVAGGGDVAGSGACTGACGARPLGTLSHTAEGARGAGAAGPGWAGAVSGLVEETGALGAVAGAAGAACEAGAAGLAWPRSLAAGLGGGAVQTSPPEEAARRPAWIASNLPLQSASCARRSATAAWSALFTPWPSLLPVSGVVNSGRKRTTTTSRYTHTRKHTNAATFPAKVSRNGAPRRPGRAIACRNVVPVTPRVTKRDS